MSHFNRILFGKADAHSDRDFCRDHSSVFRVEEDHPLPLRKMYQTQVYLVSCVCCHTAESLLSTRRRTVNERNRLSAPSTRVLCLLSAAERKARGTEQEGGVGRVVEKEHKTRGHGKERKREWYACNCGVVVHVMHYSKIRISYCKGSG